MTKAPERATRRGRLLLTALGLAVVAAGAWGLATGRVPGTGTTATVGPAAPPVAAPSATPTPIEAPRTVRAALEPGARLLGDDVGQAVVAAVEGVLERAPVVVVADPGALTPARGVAWRMRAPLVPATVVGLERLLDRLDTATVVQVVRAPAASATAPAASPSMLSGSGRMVVTLTVDGTTVDRGPLEDVAVPDRPADGVAPLVLVRADDPARALLDTLALAADVPIVAVAGTVGEDPRAVARLRRTPEAPWVVAGTTPAWHDVDAQVLAWDVAVARTGVELPGGGLRMFPGRRLVAMYGSPGAASVGILGEQPVEAAVDRARALAADYDGLVDEPVVPTFEIVTTVASGAAGAAGDYSGRVPLDRIEPWVDAAEAAGLYVILDLQPGRTDFLTQAREVKHLLRRPHVGLALDPEWRLAPDQVHLRQVGSVAVEEVQAVADWLADLTREHVLPQKLLLLHQFTMSMLPDRDQLQVPPELAVAIQMDGQGSQGAKDATWHDVTALDPPADVWFGWKNFYDEDVTLRSPADTMAVAPTPVLVSYQ